MISSRKQHNYVIFENQQFRLSFFVKIYGYCHLPFPVYNGFDRCLFCCCSDAVAHRQLLGS